MQRGWVGHQREHKWFTGVAGEVLIAVVKPDDWQSPSADLPVARYVLSAIRPQVVHVPAGYATTIYLPPSSQEQGTKKPKYGFGFQSPLHLIFRPALPPTEISVSYSHEFHQCDF